MDKDLPELYSGHTNGQSPENGRKPLILNAVKALDDGGSAKIGDTEFSLNRKRAAILTQIGDAMVEMAVNRHMEARAKARIPLMGGNLDLEANRDQDGNRRFSLQFGKEFSSAKP